LFGRIILQKRYWYKGIIHSKLSSIREYDSVGAHLKFFGSGRMSDNQKMVARFDRLPRQSAVTEEAGATAGFCHPGFLRIVFIEYLKMNADVGIDELEAGNDAFDFPFLVRIKVVGEAVV